MTAKIKLNAASGGGSVSLEAPTSTTGNANIEFKLPVADGSSGQALTTNASGQLAFASVAAGGASNIAFNDGYGIDFSATSGSGTSELFHDYEEGTWTPTAHGYTASNTTNNCFYTKIGRLVIATFRMTWPSLTNSSAAEIRNLPFTARAQAVNTHGGAFAETNDSDDLHMIVQQNTTSIYILRCRASDGVQTQTISDVSGKDFRGNVIYFTDA